MPRQRPHLTVAASVAFALLAVLPAVPTARAALPPLYPREAFFGVPERTAPALSPDGRYLSWVAPGSDSIPNVWIEEIGSGRPRQVTSGGGAGVFQYLWAADAGHILYYATTTATEQPRSCGLRRAHARPDAPSGRQGAGGGVHRRHPDQVLLSLNHATRRSSTATVNLATGRPP
jgi:hypothetical protein